MLKTYQFKTHCKGDSHSSKTANIILPGHVLKEIWTPLRVQGKLSVNSSVLMLVDWNNSSDWIWMLWLYFITLGQLKLKNSDEDYVKNAQLLRSSVQIDGKTQENLEGSCGLGYVRPGILSLKPTSATGCSRYKPAKIKVYWWVSN